MNAPRRNAAFRRSELAREMVLAARTFLYGAALSSAQPTGCALHGASLFLEWPRKSNQKEDHPNIRVLLRKTSLSPALLRGSSRRDILVPSLLARHPCLARPYAPPTLGLLKGISDRVVCKFLNGDSRTALRSFVDQQTIRRRRTPLSEGRMESAWRGASGMDAARGVKGQGWPLYAGPRSADGMREVERSETRMQGQAFLLTFFAFEKSESPSRAKPMPQPSSPIGCTRRSRSQNASRARTRRPPPLPQTTLTPRSRRPQSAAKATRSQFKESPRPCA
jgi:hypothetical protein